MARHNAFSTKSSDGTGKEHASTYDVTAKGPELVPRSLTWSLHGRDHVRPYGVKVKSSEPAR